MVSFGDAGRVASGARIQAGRELEVAVLLVEVGGDRFASRHVFVDLGQRREPRGRSIGLTDCDRTVEPHDRSVGEPQT